MAYKINYISISFESTVFQPTDDGKKNFFDDNISLNICAAMLLGKMKKIWKLAVISTVHFMGNILAGLLSRATARFRRFVFCRL